MPDENSTTIPLSENTRCFARGAVAGSKVTAAHEFVEFPDRATRIMCYWFEVGRIAEHEYHLVERTDVDMFMLGAATRAPSSTLNCKHCGSELVHEPDWYIRQMVWNDDFFHTTECDESPSKKHEPAAS